MSQNLLVTGRTRVIFMIGSPVAQARAPALFNQRFREVGVDRIMTPLMLAPEKIASFFEALRSAENCDGVIATVPLKPAVFAAMDRVTDRSRQLGLVNAARREPDGAFVGDMTDGAGFWNAAAARGFDPVGRRIALAGAGAAATAISHEFLSRGGRFVLVATSQAEEFARLVGLLGADRCARDATPQDLSGFDMVVNATPLGMAYAPGTPFAKTWLASLPPRALVADAITEPVDTQLLVDARALGLRTMTGHDMTQGAFQLMGDFLGVL
jgi:shikimate dehydrogenase